MDLLPTGTVLGNLRIVEVYAYYDWPRLFLCSNESGHSFLAHWVEEGAQGNVWLYLPVSPGRLEEIRRGAIALRSAFVDAEDAIALRIVVPRRGKTAIQRVRSDRLDLTELPDAKMRLDAKEDAFTDPGADVLRQARARSRDALLLRLEGGRREGGFPAREIGRVLAAFQSTVDAAMQAVVTGPKTTGPIADDLRAEAEFALVGVSFHSIGLQLVARSGRDLVESKIEHALEQVMALLEAGASEDKLRDTLWTLKQRCARHYRKLLAAVAYSESSLSVVWAGPSWDAARAARVNAATAREAVVLLKALELEMPEEHWRDGVLVAFDTETSRFKFKGDDGVLYVGRLQYRPEEPVTVPSRYRAHILAVYKRVRTTGQEKTDYTLLGLGPASSD